MKHAYLPILLLLTAFLSCTDDRDIPSDAIPKDPASVLIHYWNFNALSGTVETISPDFSLTSGAAISYPGTGAGYLDGFDPGYDTNARNGDTGGSGFRARNPSDTRSLILTLPTTGFKKIILQFATARSGSGATTQNYSYTVDGTNYVSTALVVNAFNPVEDPANSLATLDFTGIAAADDNADFKVKIDFTGDTAAGTTGNNRFDNVTLEGVSLGGTIPPDPTLHLFQYWNFNTLATGTLDSIAPDATLINGNTAAITYPGTGAGYMDSFSPGSSINAQNSDAAGSGLRARNPSDSRSLLISAPTTGYQNVIVKFATARSSTSGASVQNYSYTIDGTNFIASDLPVITFSPGIDPAFEIITLDFSGIAGADNNALFAVKIDFGGDEASGISGNDRFDNITFQGNTL